MEQKVSEVLENILGMLALEGSFDIEEKDDSFFVSIETEDAGKLIGQGGQTLSALQLLINQIVSKHVEDSKRVIIDIEGWKKNKEEDLANQTKIWVQQVIESKQPLELIPMQSWQRRIVHMGVQESAGVVSESLGEGENRHIVIRPADERSEDDKEATTEEPSSSTDD